MNPSSKGSQLSGKQNLPAEGPEQIIEYLNGIASTDISLYFFIYEKDTIPRIDIVDYKRRQLEEMQLAIDGMPTPRFQIQFIEEFFDYYEQRYLDNEELTERLRARKEEIYRLVYDAKNFQHH
jgi:hypothetical protein